QDVCSGRPLHGNAGHAWRHRARGGAGPQRRRARHQRPSAGEDRLHRSPPARGLLEPAAAAVTEVEARAALEAAYRNEKRRVLATLIRLLGSFEAAEEALHEAFAAAAKRWPSEGVPANPYSW